jgi:hypothetical protein
VSKTERSTPDELPAIEHSDLCAGHVSFGKGLLREGFSFPERDMAAVQPAYSTCFVALSECNRQKKQKGRRSD